jgi:hypothetical protein
VPPTFDTNSDKLRFVVFSIFVQTVFSSSSSNISPRRYDFRPVFKASLEVDIAIDDNPSDQRRAPTSTPSSDAHQAEPTHAKPSTTEQHKPVLDNDQPKPKPTLYMIIINNPSNEAQANKTKEYIDTLNQDIHKIPTPHPNDQGKVRVWGNIHLTEDGARKLKEYPGVDAVLRDGPLMYH